MALCLHSQTAQCRLSSLQPGLRNVHFDSMGDLRMQRKAYKLILSVALGLAVIFCATAFGQVLKGSISGTVTDPQGALISNAQVKATNTATGAELKTTTGSAGDFRFNLIPTGTYKVEVSAPGFKTLTQTDISVSEGGDAGLGAIKLSVGVTEY